MDKLMLKAWQQWHSDTTLEEMPMPNLCFEKAWKIQQKRIDSLEKTLKTTQEMLASALNALVKEDLQ